MIFGKLHSRTEREPELRSSDPGSGSTTSVFFLFVQCDCHAKLIGLAVELLYFKLNRSILIFAVKADSKTRISDVDNVRHVLAKRFFFTVQNE